jgi:hypothetical protein
VWFGHNFATFAKALNVEFDCFPNEPHYFLAARTCGDTTGQIRNVGAPASFASFNDDRVTHRQTHFLRPACFRILFNVPGGISTFGLPATVYRSLLCRMLKLAMTALHPSLIPPVVLKQFDKVTNFHG